MALYLNGQLVSTIAVPVEIHSSARDFALGGNPHFTGGNEHLACRVSQLAFYARSMTAADIEQLFQQQK